MENRELSMKELFKLSKSKKIISILFLANLTTAIFAFGNGLFDFSAEANMGFLNGNIYEYVFIEDYPTTDNVLSKLDWEVAVPYAQAKLSLDLIKYLHLDLSGRLGIPGKSGYMQDYDWMNPSYYYNYDVYSVRDNFDDYTHYSKSTNNLSDYKMFSASLGANINFFMITFTPFVNYEYEKYAFDGVDGYCIYEICQQDKSLNKNYIITTVEGTLSGKVISYEQSYQAFFLGLNLSASFLRFRINGFVKYSPDCTNIDAFDWHWVNSDNGGTLYWDDLSKTSQFRTEITVYYDFNDNHSLGLNFGLQKISIVKGSDYSKSLDSDGNITSSAWTLADAQGGTDRLIFNFSLSYNFRF